MGSAEHYGNFAPCSQGVALNAHFITLLVPAWSGRLDLQREQERIRLRASNENGPVYAHRSMGSSDTCCVGGAKRYMEEVESRGWADVGTTVCSGCVSDYALARAIETRGGTDRCDYCRSMPRPPESSAPIEDLLESIVDGFRCEYEDPIEQGLWSSADGGYQIPYSDTEDLLGNHEVSENGDLLSDLVRAIHQDAWAQRDPYAASPTAALRWGWESFRKYVKHSRRYTFLARDRTSGHGAGEITMDGVPSAVATAVEMAGQVRVLEAHTRFWRVRPHPVSESYRKASEIGTPPDAVAKDNRMSPKGMGAFYGSSTEVGARAEVAGYADSTHCGTFGQFELLRDISVVDLTETHHVPSLFDAAERHRRPAVTFMRDFVRDVTKVADPSDWQNLEYIPTQVIAEYLRYELTGPAGPVAGILWRSSKDPSVLNCVIFASNEEMADQGSASSASLLALDPSTVGVMDAPL